MNLHKSRRGQNWENGLRHLVNLRDEYSHLATWVRLNLLNWDNVQPRLTLEHFSVSDSKDHHVYSENNRHQQQSGSGTFTKYSVLFFIFQIVIYYKPHFAILARLYSIFEFKVYFDDISYSVPNMFF